jgi:hypothetical protein
MTAEQQIDTLIKNMGKALLDAYETGYAIAVKDTRQELLATIEKRRKEVEALDRDTLELVILRSIIENN